MKAQTNRLGLLSAAIAIAALPASAAAAPYVPPGNSAATQYTEALPTAGGPKATGKSKHGKDKSPSKVLGAHNAERLEAQGPQGHAAAEVAAETAPSAVEQTAPGAGTPQASKPEATQPAGGTGNDGSQSAKAGGGATTPQNPRAGTVATTDSGSSGLGEVVSHATGSSSGQLGVLLPLLIVAVVAWSIVYLLRQRKRPAG